MGEMFEEKVNELMRRGDKEKVSYLKSLDRTIMPSQLEKIQSNDRSVLRELVVPKWVSWELLYDWAISRKQGKGRRCILCGGQSEVGIDFKEKYICEHCFLKLKNLD